MFEFDIMQSKYKDFEPKTHLFSAPDYAAIENRFNENMTEYELLIFEYLDFEKDLSQDKYEYLYYASTFNPHYNLADMGFDMRKKVNRILGFSSSNEDLKKAEKLLVYYLVENPFALFDLALLAEVMILMNETYKYHRVMSRVYGIVNTILRSGNGQNQPFHVIHINHEYFIMRILDLTTKGQHYNNFKGVCVDKFELKENRLGLEYIYFDVSQMAKRKQQEILQYIRN